MNQFIPESIYFHGDEIYQCIHIQIPMELVMADCFKNISGDAKILYGLLLNRTGLSIRNGWEDSNGRAYICYSIEDVMDDLHISHGKASKLFAELVKIREVETDKGKKYIGLIEKIRILNKPSRIYVHKVSEIKKILEYDEQNSVVHDHGQPSSINMDDGHPQMEMTVISSSGQPSSNNVDENKNNNIINNNGIYNNHIYQSHNIEKENEKRLIDEMDEIRERIKCNIDYYAEWYNDRWHYRKEILDELIELMVEACVFPNRVKIKDEYIPVSVVKSVFQKYNMFTMQYVMNNLDNTKTKVENPKNYALAVLYNARFTYNTDTQISVNLANT